jgi:hypothetical protein
MKICSQKMKHITLGLGAVLMLGAGQAAFAHASILNAIDSGATGFSRVGLNHACNHTSPPTPIVAQSVVFPTINPILSRSDNGAITSLADFFATTASGLTGAGADASISTLANFPQLVQSRDVFSAQIEQRNEVDKVIGFVSTKGSLGLNLHGELPFRFGAVHFKNNNCAKSLRIQVAVADLCNSQQKPPLQDSTVNLGVNLWVSNQTPGLAGGPFPPGSIENGAATPILTINRNVAVNPYPANCAPNGGPDALFDVNVFPSADDIARLQYPGWGTPVAGAVFK